jgi:hypothetical protein
MTRTSKRYLSAWGALYGGTATFAAPKRRSPRRKSVVSSKPIIPTEDDEQIRFAVWLAKNMIIFYHIPNGGRRYALEAMKLKRMGVQAGVPDICIPIARSPYHGLYVELKRQKGGTLSEMQKIWRDQLRKEGYAWFLAEGADRAIACVKKYLGLK